MDVSLEMEMKRYLFTIPVILVLACGSSTTSRKSLSVIEEAEFQQTDIEKVEQEVQEEPNKLSEFLSEFAEYETQIEETAPKFDENMTEIIESKEVIIQTESMETLSPYSDTVSACIYVIENMCEKAIKKCDEQLLDIIPSDWIKKCSDFLVQNESMIVQACLTLDSSTSSDPKIEMIKNIGPTALKMCIDNFQCTISNIGKIADVFLPIFKGQKIDTSSILNIIGELCFP